MAALDDLASTAGVDGAVVAFLADADRAELSALTGAVRAARSQREAELASAVDRALGFVPRPLRGRIRRLLGGGGRG